MFNSSKLLCYNIYSWEDIQIEERIGSGANGEVSRCVINGKKYAIKRIYNEWVKTKKDKQQYKKDIYDELLNCSKMKGNKRLMEVYGYCESGGEFYIICELIDNKGCLLNYLNNHNLGYHDNLKIFKSILLAVQQLHKKNVVHGDLKPDNMVYYFDYDIKVKYVKLIDFNTSYIMNDTDEYDIAYVHGTYGYCAMEQHKYRINKKSDIYSLGVILLELINDSDLWDINIYNYQKYRKSILNNLKNVKDDNIKRIIKRCISVKSEIRYNINELVEEYKKVINNIIY